jgi:hypothetical protein
MTAQRFYLIFTKSPFSQPARDFKRSKLISPGKINVQTHDRHAGSNLMIIYHFVTSVIKIPPGSLPVAVEWFVLRLNYYPRYEKNVRCYHVH